MYKLVQISFSFSRGGAAIASGKFVNLAVNFDGLKILKISQDHANKFQFIKRLMSFGLSKLQFDGNPVKHSLNLFSYPPAIEFFEKNNESLYHIHWINNDTISIFDFDKIPRGSIFTLHDEWLYCGSEHYYKVSDEKNHFKYGYPFFVKGNFGAPWNNIIWKIKFNKLSCRRDLIYTVPSIWMLDRAKSSLILRNSDIRLLPNPIDTEMFKPLSSNETHQFRVNVGFSDTDFIFCFGAVGGKSSYLKGAALLEEALKVLRRDLDGELRGRVKILIFGGNQCGVSTYAGFDTFYLGHIPDPRDLAKVYASSDCVVVPSLVESFGQVAAEALACEAPVISFACSGLQDIVINDVTGLCAEPFSVESLAEKFKEMLEKPVFDRKKIGENGRDHVIKNFSYPVVAEKYKSIIDDAISLKAG